MKFTVEKIIKYTIVVAILFADFLYLPSVLTFLNTTMIWIAQAAIAFAVIIYVAHSSHNEGENTERRSWVKWRNKREGR